MALKVLITVFLFAFILAANIIVPLTSEAEPLPSPTLMTLCENTSTEHANTESSEALSTTSSTNGTAQPEYNWDKVYTLKNRVVFIFVG